MHTIPAYRGEEDMAQYMQAMLGCRVCRPGARRERERERGWRGEDNGGGDGGRRRNGKGGKTIKGDGRRRKRREGEREG